WRHIPRAQTSVAIAMTVRTPAARTALLTRSSESQCPEGTFLDCFSSVVFRHIPATIGKRPPLTLSHQAGPVIAIAAPDCRTAIERRTYADKSTPGVGGSRRVGRPVRDRRDGDRARTGSRVNPPGPVGSMAVEPGAQRERRVQAAGDAVAIRRPWPRWPYGT